MICNNCGEGSARFGDGDFSRGGTSSTPDMTCSWAVLVDVALIIIVMEQNCNFHFSTTIYCVLLLTAFSSPSPSPPPSAVMAFLESFVRSLSVDTLTRVIIRFCKSPFNLSDFYGIVMDGNFFCCSLAFTG